MKAHGTMLRLKLLLFLLGFVLVVLCEPAEGRQLCAAGTRQTGVSAPQLCWR